MHSILAVDDPGTPCRTDFAVRADALRLARGMAEAFAAGRRANR